MQANATAVSAAAAFLVSASQFLLFAQAGEYRKVDAITIASGRVPEGDLIETKGFLYVSSEGVMLKINCVSAAAPAFIDLAHVAAETAVKVMNECKGEGIIPKTGCLAVVRGAARKRAAGTRDVYGGVSATAIEARPARCLDR